MTELFTALALALAIEGMLYALFPQAMKRFMGQALEAPEQVLRTAGLVAAIAGAAVIALIRM